MTTINKEQITLLFTLSRKVYNKELGLKGALALATEKNINASSARNYINNYKHLINGEKFTRTMNAEGLEYYLENILLLDGVKTLLQALNALKLHIDYYQKTSKSQPIRSQNILEAFFDKCSVMLLDSNDDQDDIRSNLYTEGRLKKVEANIFDRSRIARAKCVELYGSSCLICGFNFAEIYGEIGDGFIHVHHLKELAEIKIEYRVDPKKDLLPVCPNCHAMIHRKNPAYTPEELKMMIEQRRFK